MKNRVKYLAILFFAVIGMSSCNPDPEITDLPTGSSIATFEQALNAIQGTWYLDYCEDVLYSCSNAAGEVLSRRMSDLSYSDFEFQFTNTAAVSMFGSGLSQYNTSGVYQMYGAGGAYNCPFYFYKTGASGNTFNPLLGVSTNPDQLYFYSENSFQFDNNVFGAGGRITFIDAEHFSMEVSNVSTGRTVLHFTKNNINFSGTAEIQNIKGNYIPNYKEIYISNALMQSLSLDPFPMNITDSLLSPIASINISSGSSLFPAFREVWYIAHGMDGVWDGTSSANVSYYYPIGYDNSGNWIGREGELMMLNNGTLTLSQDYSNGPPVVFKIILSNSSELVLRSYQGCNDYVDYHFTKVN